MISTAAQSIKKHTAHKILWLFLGRLTPVIVLFIITILYSRHLSYQDYGRFQAVWIYSSVLAIFIGFGLPSLILSMDTGQIGNYIKKQKHKIGLFYVGLITTISIAFFLFDKDLSIASRLLIILFALIQSKLSIWEALLLKQQKQQQIFIANFFYALLLLAWHCFLLQKPFNLPVLIGGLISTTLCKGLIYFFTRLIFEPAITAKHNSVFNQWIFLGFNDVFGVIARWIDKMFILAISTPAAFAIFFNGAIEIPLFSIMIGVVGSVMMVDIAFETENHKKTIHLFRQTFHVLSGIVFPLFCFFLFYHKEVFQLAFQHKYDASIPIFLISIFILPVRINNYAVILQCYNKSNEVLKGSALDVFIALLLMLLLHPILGAGGIALAIVIATYIQACYYLYQSAKALTVPVLHLLPIKYLFKHFTITIVLYVILFYTLQRVSFPYELVIALTITAGIIIYNLLYYFKKKNTTY